MKILRVTEIDLIEACKNQEPNAQRQLYREYAPKMFGLLKRYVKRREDAEDVLIEAFFKVLDNIDRFQGSGSFEGWVRRIVVNEALMFLRRKHNFNLSLDATDMDIPSTANAGQELQAADILQLLDQLPTGYRTVFNLYVLEGYKHREIAELLGISINTSKSQLILAKKRLRQLLGDLNYPGVPKQQP